MKKITCLLTISLLAFSCKKKDDAPTPTPTPTPTPATEKEHINATIDGIAWEAVQGANGCYIGDGQSASINSATGDMNIDYSASFEQSSSVSPITAPLIGTLEIDFSGFMHNLGTYDETVFRTAVTSMSSNYYVNGSTTPGPEVVYYDQSGEEWSTKYGSQTGHNFTITTNEKGPATVDGNSQTVKATYNCKLYSQSNPSAFKTVSSGSCFVYFEKY